MRPGSILFVCGMNAIRSPMAEGMMKKFYGRAAYVQSAGVRNDMEVDGFAIAVCKEIGVEISTHRSRSFEEMKEWGDDLGSFDLVVALSYLVFLGAIGVLMLNESLTEILRRRRGLPAPHKQRRRPMWLYGLPLKMKFPKSGLYISALPPFGLGVFAGVLSAIVLGYVYPGAVQYFSVRPSEELREQLGKSWSARRNELLEAGAGSIEQVESIVKQAYDDGLLPNDDQPS